MADRIRPQSRRRTGTPIERFEAQIASGDGGCWVWQGRLNYKGYGVFYAEGKTLAAHRWSYEHHRGAIPEGLVIDHLCRNRACVNPDHLEPVTIAENTARGYWGDRTHCSRGHRFTPESTTVRPDGSRYCRLCFRERVREWRAERRRLGLPYK